MDNVDKKDKEKPSKPKIEINFETYLRDEKSKIDELKNYFTNKNNDTDNDFKNFNSIVYNTDDERLRVIKKLLSLYISNKKISLPFKYKKLVHVFIIDEFIKINAKNPFLKTLNLDALKSTFLPNLVGFETVIKLSSFFCNKIAKDEIDNEINQKNKLIFLDLLKLYINFMVDTVNWLTIEQIRKLADAIESFKTKELTDKKIVSNSLYFINKSDYIFSFNEMFVPLKNEIQKLNLINNSNENTISNMREIIEQKKDDLVQLEYKRSELEKEKNTLEQNLQMVKLKGDANQAGSWQVKNEIIGKVQNTLTSFLNYELHIASEAILNGEKGAVKASKMIEKLIKKIKEEKEWLSSLD